MNVDVAQNEDNVAEKRLQPLTSFQPSQHKDIVIGAAFGIVGAIILIIVFVCLCKRYHGRRKLRKGAEMSSNSTIVSNSTDVYSIPIEAPIRTTQDVAKRYARSVSSISTKSQIYLVSFDVLPPDFDYSSREVEVKADYVILKDLRLLERYNSTYDGGVVNEAYEEQQPYNPHIYGTIPPLEREPYKKQSAFNPTFY